MGPHGGPDPAPANEPRLRVAVRADDLIPIGTEEDLGGSPVPVWQHLEKHSPIAPGREGCRGLHPTGVIDCCQRHRSDGGVVHVQRGKRANGVDRSRSTGQPHQASLVGVMPHRGDHHLIDGLIARRRGPRLAAIARNPPDAEPTVVTLQRVPIAGHVDSPDPAERVVERRHRFRGGLRRLPALDAMPSCVRRDQRDRVPEAGDGDPQRDIQTNRGRGRQRRNGHRAGGDLLVDPPRIRRGRRPDQPPQDDPSGHNPDTTGPPRRTASREGSRRTKRWVDGYRVIWHGSPP